MAPSTSETVRNRIIELYGSQQFSVQQMAEIVGVSRNTVTKYINRYVETGRVYVLKPTGRPEKLTQEQAETLRDAALSNRFASHADLLASVNGIQSLDTKTVSRYLRRYGIKSRIAAQKTLLGPTERANRMEIARRNLCREESDFFRTIYGDEYFSLNSSSGFWPIKPGLRLASEKTSFENL